MLVNQQLTHPPQPDAVWKYSKWIKHTAAPAKTSDLSENLVMFLLTSKKQNEQPFTLHQCQAGIRGPAPTRKLRGWWQGAEATEFKWINKTKSCLAPAWVHLSLMEGIVPGLPPRNSIKHLPKWCLGVSTLQPKECERAAYNRGMDLDVKQNMVRKGREGYWGVAGGIKRGHKVKKRGGRWRELD